MRDCRLRRKEGEHRASSVCDEKRARLSGGRCGCRASSKAPEAREGYGRSERENVHVCVCVRGEAAGRTLDEGELLLERAKALQEGVLLLLEGKGGRMWQTLRKARVTGVGGPH